MSYIRSKMVYGCGPYYYEVKSVRESNAVHQIYVRYIGKTPSARPRKARTPSSKNIAKCIIDTRALAQKLRDYDAAAKQNLQELADKLNALRHIEATTDDNEELNRVQAEIPRVKKHAEELGKMSPEAIRAEFKELTEKCPGISVRLSKHSNVIRFHYKANAVESQSVVVRRDAKQLYEQLLKKRREQ